MDETKLGNIELAAGRTADGSYGVALMLAGAPICTERASGPDGPEGPEGEPKLGCIMLPHHARRTAWALLFWAESIEHGFTGTDPIWMLKL